MASTVRVMLHESATILEPCYDLYEQNVAVRRLVSEAELVALCEAVKGETGFSFPSPVAMSSADKAALKAIDAQAQQANKSFFPFMSSFMNNEERKGGGRHGGQNGAHNGNGNSQQYQREQQNAEAGGPRSGSLMLSSASREALEARRAGWEGWLGAAYANERVAENSEALVDFVCAHEMSGLSKEDGQVARSARRRRLVAEAKAVAETKGREELKARLRTRENEVARDIGELEVKAAQLSRSVASLRIRRQQLNEFIESRMAWRDSRHERREGSLAQRGRLREELATAEKAAAAALERAAAGRDRRDAEAATGAATREAGERECDLAAASLRAAQDDANAFEERAARCRGRLGQRSAEAEAAVAEASRAAEARRWAEEVELPRCEADKAAAGERRRQAEIALATHKRMAVTRTGRLGVELGRRHDELDAVDALAKLLDISPSELDKKLGVVSDLSANDSSSSASSSTPHPEGDAFADDGTVDSNATDASSSNHNSDFNKIASAFGGLHHSGSAESSSSEMSTRRRLMEAYTAAVHEVEVALESSRRADSEKTNILEDDLEAARSAETALARVAASAVDRRDALRESSRRAARAAASALAAKQAARRDLEDTLLREQQARADLNEAHLALDAKVRANKVLAVETTAREKTLRHALDADTHVASRLVAAASAEADALAQARGRLLDADDDEDTDGASTSIQVPHSVPDVLDLARDELARVDVKVAAHEVDKAKIRNDIAGVNADWEKESVALRAKLHGADCQLRIFRDEAQAAMRMQRDALDTMST